MKWALDQESRSFVTVDELRTQRLPDVSRSALNRSILCTECGNPVFVKEDQKDGSLHPHFAHYKDDHRGHTDLEALKACPLYKIRGGHFDKLMKQCAAPREKARVLAILALPDVWRFNNALLQVLYRRMTGFSLTDKQGASMYDKAVEDFGACGVLYSHPYLLPYMKLAAYESLSRKGERGRHIVVKASQSGGSYILYVDAARLRHQAAIPHHLQMMYAAHNTWKPMTYADTARIPVSLHAAAKMTQLAVPAVMEELVKAETDRRTDPSPQRESRPPKRTYYRLLPGLAGHLLQSYE